MVSLGFTGCKLRATAYSPPTFLSCSSGTEATAAKAAMVVAATATMAMELIK